jgi:FkbM family methyltransferase
MGVFVAAPWGQRVLDAPTLVGTWRETAALMAQADVVVANDSGPMHLAGTLGVTTIALLGPTTDGVTAHMASVHCLSVSKRELDCVGCWGRYGYDSSCDLGCTALSMLSVDRVASAVSRVLTPDAACDTLITHFCGVTIRGGARGRRDAQIVNEQFGANVYRLTASDARLRVLDVGAHIGAFAVHCRQLMPNAQLACVEACPDNLDCLQANVGEFAAVRHAAVTYEPGPLVLLNSITEFHPDTAGSYVASRSVPTPLGFVTDARPLATTTLEDLMNALGWDAIDLLKLDCEGSEHSILRQSPAVRRGQVRRIVGEYHGRQAWAETSKYLADWHIQVFCDGDIGLFEASHVSHR